MARALILKVCTFAALLAAGAEALPHPVARPWLFCRNGPCDISRRDLPVEQIASELGPQLSSAAAIFGPQDDRWAEATARFQALVRPDVRIVIQPGQESDVSKIVTYANENSIDFMATNRKHALTVTVGDFAGLEIDLSLLRSICVHKNSSTVTIGGGSYGEDLWTQLWDKGYVTTTGSATCVGVMGPGLGGGHGRWQGHYGLVSDNFVRLNVVLANGSAIVVSENSHPDLFWAMKGAGHNFGIVTSAEMKLYDRGPSTWYYKIYNWNQTQIEPVFEALNKLREDGKPKELAVNYGAYLLNASISTTEPIFWWSFVYIGTKEEAQPYLDPFDAIEALDVQEGDVPYPEIAEKTLTGESSGLCTPGYTHNHATSYTKTWNLEAQRKTYDLFAERINERPEWVNSAVVMEDYAQDGVSAVDPATSAYPWREFTLLSYINVGYAPNETLDESARDWAVETRDIWNAGQPDEVVATYVNYARGEESLESMYGYEPWRLERLRELKTMYDPQNHFRYYNGIQPQE